MSAKRSWQAPSLTEVSLTERQLSSINDVRNERRYLNDHCLSPLPENAIRSGRFHNQLHVLTHLLDPLPEKAIRAALPTTLPAASRGHVWFQLAERDRRAYTIIRFHDQLHAILRGREQQQSEQQSIVNWLRWLAVRDAQSEGRSWEKAREKASNRLASTLAAGAPGTMKYSYDLIQRILKAANLQLI